jgi:hypothetical protein
MLSELRSYVRGGKDTIPIAGEPHAVSGLEEVFDALDGSNGHRLPRPNACTHAFEAKIDSILQFLGIRYPLVDGSALRALACKAYSAVAGSVLGEFAFWAQQESTRPDQLQRLDGLLRGGMRR